MKLQQGALLSLFIVCTWSSVAWTMTKALRQPREEGLWTNRFREKTEKSVELMSPYKSKRVQEPVYQKPPEQQSLIDVSSPQKLCNSIRKTLLLPGQTVEKVADTIKVAFKKNNFAQENTLNNIIDDNENTALHIATGYGVEVVQALLIAGANVNTRNKWNRTPLHCVASHVSGATDRSLIDVVKILLDSGAYVDAIDDNKFTALHWLAYNSGISVYNSNANCSCVVVYEIAKKLLHVGANPLIVDYMGRMPLHLAAYNGDSNLVDLLLQQSSACYMLNVQDARDKWTPLFHAVFWGHVRVVLALVLAGAYLEVVDQYQQTAYGLAVFREKQIAHEFALSRENAPDFALFCKQGKDINYYDCMTVTHILWVANAMKAKASSVKKAAIIEAAEWFEFKECLPYRISPT